MLEIISIKSMLAQIKHHGYRENTHLLLIPQFHIIPIPEEIKMKKYITKYANSIK